MNTEAMEARIAALEQDVKLLLAHIASAPSQGDEVDNSDEGREKMRQRYDNYRETLSTIRARVSDTR